MNNKIFIHFLGAAGTVTGSKYLIEAPENIFVIHGKKQAAETFKMKIKDTFGWEAVVPNLYKVVEVDIVK